METYADYAQYTAMFPEAGAEEEVSHQLEAASRDIDVLTLFRIPGRGGYQTLSEFQRRMVSQCTCRQAKFRQDNEDMLSGVLASYSISGVSMSFDAGRVKQIGGVYTPHDVYSALAATGLCYAGVV